MDDDKTSLKEDEEEQEQEKDMGVRFFKRTKDRM